MSGADEGEELAARVLLQRNRVADVRPVEALQEQQRAFQLQAAADVLAGLGIGRRRQRQARHAGKAGGQLVELHIFRAEVMAPLADAMGLVDGEEIFSPSSSSRKERRAPGAT
jgi:hypothetical protein